MVYERRGEILMGIRKGAHGAGTWSLPGGHLEEGETAEEAGARELLEETGIKVRSQDCFKTTYADTYFPELGVRYITLYLRASGLDPEVEPEVMEPNKCGGWAWFSRDKLPSPLFRPIEGLIADQGGIP